MLLTLALGMLLRKSPFIRDGFMALNDALAGIGESIGPRSLKGPLARRNPCLNPP
jgi:hypothetical protein